MEAIGVVRVPQDHHAVAEAPVVERVGDEAHRPGRVPLLAQHDHVLAGGGRRRDDVFYEALRQARVPVANLPLFPVVDAAAMLGGDPLRPTPIHEAAGLVALLAGQIGVATEVEVCLVAELGEGAREAFDPDAQAARLAVNVGALKAEDRKNGLPGVEDHQPASGRSELPLRSVAIPPASFRMRRLAAMSKTRTGTGAQNASKLPEAVCAIASAIEPRMRILPDRWTRPRARSSALGVLSSATSSRPPPVCEVTSIGSPPRHAPCPRTAVQVSPLMRFTTQPARVSPMVGPSSSASITPKKGTPCLAFRLPSTGSTSTSG